MGEVFGEDAGGRVGVMRSAGSLVWSGRAPSGFRWVVEQHQLINLQCKGAGVEFKIIFNGLKTSL
jgi:hypothetical protein